MAKFFVFGLVFFVQGIFLQSSYAAPVPELSQFFSQRIEQLQSALLCKDSTLLPGLDLGQPQDINIDFAGQIDFGLTGVLNMAVSTEIDFVLAPDSAEPTDAEKASP